MKQAGARLQVTMTDEANETVAQVGALEQHENDEYYHQAGGGERGDQRPDNGLKDFEGAHFRPLDDHRYWPALGALRG